MNYLMIDKFLRNNLDDDGYAEYSAALDAITTHAQQAEKRVPLTDDQIEEIELAQEFGVLYIDLTPFARAIERAHGILPAVAKDVP